MGRVIGFVFSAGGSILALLLVAIWLALRPASKAPRRIAIAAALFYVLGSTTLAPFLVSRLLTAGYHQLQPSDVPPGRVAVVLLGGGDEFVQGWTSSITVTTATEAERVLEAARVFTLIAPATIISAGGQPDPTAISLPSAMTMRDELVRLGIPANRIVLEAASRSTRENALLVAPLLRSLGADRIVLVTSAVHMRRAMGAFRAVGLDAIPAIAPPIGAPSDWDDWRPSAGTLAESNAIAREVVGIPYYWLRGWWKG